MVRVCSRQKHHLNELIGPKPLTYFDVMSVTKKTIFNIEIRSVVEGCMLVIFFYTSIKRSSSKFITFVKHQIQGTLTDGEGTVQLTSSLR